MERLTMAEQVVIEVALEQAISRHIGFARYFRRNGERRIARDSIARARSILSAAHKFGLNVQAIADPDRSV